ncbi:MULTISPECIES: DNA polymerase Y family protein [unclassified Caulobacter]|uniref:DNA polymerase Y family protein n=1 Tax=unclassified Caulobacter TaxID=2648921 RepID=UPI001F334835|nr:MULTISPECIES: DNA polymerase Y family protein [unclassified Caulobacter]
MPRILSVWCPNWPITTWRRRNPCGGSAEVTGPLRAYGAPPPEGEDGRRTPSSPSGGGGCEASGGGKPSPEPPFALLVSDHGTRRLAAVDERARALGLSAGQKAADALALVPDLVTADHDPAADRAALEALSDWCVRFSPAVALDGDDGLLLDITGTDHLWGGEGAMLVDLVARLARWGVPARAAIADTAGAAWALARFGDDLAIAPPGGQRVAIEDLPVAALRLEDAAEAQLPRLGLHRVGQLFALPRAQLAKRFGLALTLRLDQALGAAAEALTFRRPASPWFDRLAFFEPISAPEDLARVAGDALALICARLEAEGRGAKRFEVVFHRLDGRAYPVRAGLARIGRDARRLTRLIVPKLDKVDPGFGIEVVTVHAGGVEALAAAQERLDSEAGNDLDETLAPLIDRLVNRLGENRVWRADPYESHVPERSVVRVAPLDPLAAARWDPDRPRPVRLFKRPEAITALAKVPDDPPVQFTWRGRSHRVRRAEGPERIGQEWWRAGTGEGETGPDKIRDYYRVEDEAGGRFWIYRQGLFDGDETPKWWIHGLFG